jgi:hypothetical protein
VVEQLDLAKPEDIEPKLMALQKEHEALTAKVKSCRSSTHSRPEKL